MKTEINTDQVWLRFQINYYSRRMWLSLTDYRLIVYNVDEV